MTTTAVTLPPSLAFLVSNFHALVNVKLDGGNYLLWRIQVKNVMRANGYFDYLEGTVEIPPLQIRNSEDVLGPNSAYILWKLIDSQLLSCLTASLSQTTLPYVLGLTSAQQVWESLSHRYNSLSRNHVQELKTRLYSHTKLTTMESYIDTIKDYAQKLAAAGSPLDENDLIFHTLRGLPKPFNGFKTAIRTRGDTISFAELVTMLKGEDLQLLQDSEVDTTTVLVANQSSPGPLCVNGGSQQSSVTSQPPSLQQPSASSGQPQFWSQQNLPQHSFNPSQFSGTSVQHMPQHYFPFSARNFPRGRGRGPRPPCDICGRSNHITAYCYYKPQQPFDYGSLQWGSPYPPPLLGFPLPGWHLLLWHIQGHLDISQASHLQVIHFQGSLCINQGSLLSTDYLAQAQAIQEVLMVLLAQLCHHRHILLLILLELFRVFPLLIPLLCLSLSMVQLQRDPLMEQYQFLQGFLAPMSKPQLLIHLTLGTLIAGLPTTLPTISTT